MQQPGRGVHVLKALLTDWQTLAGQSLVMGQLLRAAGLWAVPA